MKALAIMTILLNLPVHAATRHQLNGYELAIVDPLALMIEGEGYHLVGDDIRAGIALVHTALNHMQQSGNTVEKEMARWYGFGERIKDPSPPSDRSVAIVKTALKLYNELDYSHGSKFMLSKQDVESLDIDPKRAVVSFENGVWGLYGYRSLQP